MDVSISLPPCDSPVTKSADYELWMGIKTSRRAFRVCIYSFQPQNFLDLRVWVGDPGICIPKKDPGDSDAQNPGRQSLDHRTRAKHFSMTYETFPLGLMMFQAQGAHFKANLHRLLGRTGECKRVLMTQNMLFLLHYGNTILPSLFTFFFLSLFCIVFFPSPLWNIGDIGEPRILSEAASIVTLHIFLGSYIHPTVTSITLVIKGTDSWVRFSGFNPRSVTLHAFFLSSIKWEYQ